MHHALLDIHFMMLLEEVRLGHKFYFYKRSNHEDFSRRETKSQELSKVSSCVQSTTPESLTVPTMQ